MPPTILLAIADPNLFQALPIITVFLNREPRSRHKVDAFESQADPDVVQPNPFDGSARHQRLKVFRFHFEHMATIKGNQRWLKPCANLSSFVNHAN